MIGPFSSVSRQMDHFFADRPHPYQVLNTRIDSEIGPASSILEIGCGRTAPCLRKLRGKAQRLYGIDLVEFADTFEDLVLINEDASDMRSIPDGTIDLAFSRSVMEHVNDAEAVYREIFRVLKPGGRYIFLTPNRYDYVSLLATAVPNRFHAAIVRRTEGRREANTFPTFYRSNSFSEIRRLSASEGFQILELSRLNQYPGYLAFSRALFWCGCLYERVLDKVGALDCLKGWILCALEKPRAQSGGSDTSSA